MRTGHYILGLIAVVLVLLGGSYVTRQYFSDKTEPSPSPVSSIEETPSSELTMDLSASPSGQLEGKSFILENPTIAIKKAPAQVTFEKRILPDDVSAINQKIVEPYILYQDQIDGTQVLETVNVTINTQERAEMYPYFFSANFEGGAKQEFVIERKDKSFQWFVPECLGPCPFSESFKLKYPEIVQLSEQK